MTTELSSLPFSCRVDLLQSLPYDVVITILSFLTQQDCLRCLEVCREWSTLIPMYARETVFREIQLDEQHLDGSSRSNMHKFLGPHVDAVSFKKCHRLDRVLDMLHAKQCSNIQRLDFTGGVWLSRRHIAMVTKRLPMFPGITDLRLEYVDNGYDVYNLMTQCMVQCPLLECLWIIPTPATFFVDHDDDDVAMLPATTTTTSNPNTNMSFLRLRFDDEVDNARLASVLSLCPNLTRFSITTYSDPEPFIFELCPQLQYLEWNPRTEDFILWPPLSNKEKTHHEGLHYLATTDTALSCMPRHHRIQTLKLVDMSYDYEPETMHFLDTCRHVEEIMFDTLESIEIPRQLLPKLSAHLSRLTLSILDPDTADGLVDYFVNHANTIRLETLEINLPIAHSLTKVLEAMAHVTTLKHVEISPACVEEETLKTYLMHAPPQLEHLSMDHGPILSLETFTLLGNLPHLRILTMASYYNTEPISGAGIKALIEKKKSNPSFSLSITCKKVEDDKGYIKYAQSQLGERFSFIMLD